MISIGRHQIMALSVRSVSTFLNTHFLIPLNSFLKPMLVLILTNMVNYRSATMGSGLTLRMNGFSLSDIFDSKSNPGRSSSL